MKGLRRPGRPACKRWRAAAAPGLSPEGCLTINCLPDELMLKVFSEVATLKWADDRESDVPLCYHDHVCPGTSLRYYPFLAQVCSRWRRLLAAPSAQKTLWPQLVVDFGQELVTAVHKAVRWTRGRPTDAEFRALFMRMRISSAKVVQFIRERRGIITSLAVLNADGYWSDEGEFVDMRGKHDFTAELLGQVLGLLDGHLHELQVMSSGGLFPGGDGLGAISAALSLQRLHLMELPPALLFRAVARLGHLTRLEELSLCCGEHGRAEYPLFHRADPALTTLPDSWRALVRLRKLVLRGLPSLRAMPAWVGQLPLENLTVAACGPLTRLHPLTQLTALRSLVLQACGLVAEGDPQAAVYAPGAQSVLPDLRPLSRLTALCLRDNHLHAVPPLPACTALVNVDLAYNGTLQVAAPLHWLARLQMVRVVDLRGVHNDGQAYWSEAKCRTMRHIADLAKALKRRNKHARVQFSPG